MAKHQPPGADPEAQDLLPTCIYHQTLESGERLPPNDVGMSLALDASSLKSNNRTPPVSVSVSVQCIC